MLITGCQITNYKSFRSSEEIKFSAGFNVIVGQNNAGKTSLLECLGLKFQDNPHRSSSTVPALGAMVNKISKVRSRFFVTATESKMILERLERFEVPRIENEPVDRAVTRFKTWIGSDQDVIITFENSQPEQVEMNEIGSGFSNYHVPVEFDAVSGQFKASGGHGSGSNAKSTFAAQYIENLAQRIYLFQAERLNIASCTIGISAVLLPDARNLAEVLHLLQSNKGRFGRFVKDVRTVFPDVYDISVTPNSPQQVRIDVWPVEPVSERQDLALPLSDCGTGIGQVLAILYVVLSADAPRTILIDEPQSFLHPGAIRKLFEILKRYPQHQYIITTHSPTVITAASPCNVILLLRENGETRSEIVDLNETTDLRNYLSEIGARLSDVFGADQILWVEGRTEEICFRKIVVKILNRPLQGLEILGVTHTGDLAGRHSEIALEIYERLCKGRGLLPPALGFCFDREGRSETERQELTAKSKGLIRFIPRRMYENYLLNANAIAHVLNQADSGRAAPVTEEEVEKWMTDNGGSQDNMKPAKGSVWKRDGNAAKLLSDLFDTLSNSRVCFVKTRHGIQLTDWIIENCPEDLQELLSFLEGIISNPKTHS